MLRQVLAAVPPAPEVQAAGWDWELLAAVASPLVAVLALVVAALARGDSRRSSQANVDSADAAKKAARAAERSAMTGEAAVTASQRSADAAEEANALLRREAEQRERDRQDAAGPQFVPEESTVSEDRTARIVMRIHGGPPGMRVVVRPAGVPWCRGITAGLSGEDIAISIEFPPRQPGDDVALTAHLTGPIWHGHRRVILPLSVTASTRDESESWVRDVPVPLLPPPAPPGMA